MASQQPATSATGSNPAAAQSAYGANRPRGSRGGGRGYRGTGERGSRGTYRGRGRGDSSRGGGDSYYDRNNQQPKSVNLPTAGDSRPAANSANRFQHMLNGPATTGGRVQREKKAYGAKPEGKSAASAKFDALFGGSGPAEDPAIIAATTADEGQTQATDIDQILEESLAPRKQSNVDSAQGGHKGDTRKESNVSAGSGNRQLNALFGAKEDEAIVSTPQVQKPRKRYDKDTLLSKFRKTVELDMTVFEPERMLDYADLFISTGDKPTFTKGQSLEDEEDEEKDPFDDMMGEAEKTKQTGGLVPESIERTEKQPDHPLQQKGGQYQGYNNNRGYQNKQYHNANTQRQQHYRSNAATNFAAYDENEDEDPEWGGFDPEKETGNFFGREIPKEVELRNQLEEQRNRWGGAARKVTADEEDEFDLMMEEEIAQSSKKEIGKQSVETAVAAPVIVEEETLDNAEDVAAYSASKTLDEISEEVPQNIKDKIIDLEAEQQEKLRATMLKDTFQPKTSAIKNLQDMFADYPVVTNESLKLKMETIGQIPIDQESSVDPVTSLDSKQQVFSRLLTSINPFAQFVIREMVLNGQQSQSISIKNWELDEKILQRHPGEEIKKEHLLKTSSEMFSIYMYTKDPSMMIKSDVYTEGEFKAVKDLVSLEDSLLVSSQMANSLLLLSQHEKMLKDAQSKMNESAAAGPSTTGGDQSKDTTKATDERKFAIGETLEDEDEETNDQNQAEQSVPAPAAEDEDNDVLADLNAQLKNMLM